MKRRCEFEMALGRPCGAPPGKRSRFCFWHDPERADDLGDAQRVGGIRRKRERSVAAAFDFTGLGTIESIWRLIEIAVIDALGMENTIARARLLISAAGTATKLLEAGDFEERLAALEATREKTDESPDAGDL